VLKMNTTHSSSLAAETPAYAQLQREIHHALLAQHPEWILPNGDCPTCDSYEARLAKLLIQSLEVAPRRLKQDNPHQSQYEFQYPSRVSTTHHLQ
jgi:hypothetical protein